MNDAQLARQIGKKIAELKKEAKKPPQIVEKLVVKESDIVKKLDKLDELVQLFKDFKVEIPSEVTVKNLPDPVTEVSVKNLNDISREVTVKNIKDVPLVEIPPFPTIPPQKTIKFPEFPKIPEFPDIDLSKLADIKKLLESIREDLSKLKLKNDAENPLAVRLSNGKKFYDMMNQVIQAGALVSGGGGSAAYAQQYGAETKALIDEERRVVVAPIKIGDSANVDSFSRLRVSNPVALFDAQFTYDIRPLLFGQVTAESGATIAHSSADRCALMTFSSTPINGKAYMQSYEYIPYQPGKSQLIFVTFNMIESKLNTLKFAGYSDGTNGIEFQNNGQVNRICIYSGTGNGNQIVNQSSWNLDKLDGSGSSGAVLDISKTQILVIDLQALYVGRVRVGFDIGGVIVYAHEFTHANRVSSPYIQTANLPIRCGMTCTATVSTTMKFICCSVSSEGGVEDTAGQSFSVGGTATAGSGARTHLLSIRPKTTFNSISNRSKFVLDSIDILVTGNSPVAWELCLGQAISGTTAFVEANASYSAFEYNTLGTISGGPSIVVASGYVAASAVAKSVTSAKVASKYPITLDSAGAVRSMGTLTLLVTGVGGSSATRAVLNWREIR